MGYKGYGWGRDMWGGVIMPGGMLLGKKLAEIGKYRLPAFGRLAERRKMENSPLGRYNVVYLYYIYLYFEKCKLSIIVYIGTVEQNGGSLVFVYCII